MKTQIDNIEILRSNKRKTISLQITQDAKVILRVPNYAKKNDIDNILEKHLVWIEKKQKEIKLRQIKSPKKKFITGEYFYYLGKKYPIKISSNTKKKFFFDNSCFYLKEMPADKIKREFVNWYKKQAKSIISDRVLYYSETYNFKFNTIRLSSAKTRWGSCSSKKNLNFVWRLVMAPLKIIDYVVVHELVHTQEMHHQRTFWNKVANIIPEYKKHRKWLKENGYLLEI